MAHHGLQRNGTNFLLLVLKKYGLFVINEIDPSRNKPQHKHCRWYSKKSKIPLVISKQYSNNYLVNNIFELNKLAKYPKNTKHIVIYKSKNNAIVSILNWGIKCKWFRSKKDALSNLKNFMDDYEEYLKFWKKMKKINPEHVELIQYEKLNNQTKIISFSLNNLGLKIKKINENLSFNEIPQSPLSRKNHISLDDILFMTSDKMIFNERFRDN